MFRCLPVPSLLRFPWLVFLLVVLNVSWAGAFILPDTGITACYDADGNAIICPLPGESYYGQDANFGQGAIIYSANGDGTRTEANSGLIWELKTDADGQADPANPGDADNRYSWAEAQALVVQMNAANYLGHADWRLPSSAELAYLLDLSVAEPGPTISLSDFPNAQAGNYWSADADSENVDNGWVVDFSTAADTVLAKTVPCYVRVVRGGVQ